MSTPSERDAFDAWFREYVGVMPLPEKSILDLELDAKNAMSALNRRMAWENKRQAAISAWSEARYHRPEAK